MFVYKTELYDFCMKKTTTELCDFCMKKQQQNYVTFV